MAQRNHASDAVALRPQRRPVSGNGHTPGNDGQQGAADRAFTRQTDVDGEPPYLVIHAARGHQGNQGTVIRRVQNALARYRIDAPVGQEKSYPSQASGITLNGAEAKVGFNGDVGIDDDAMMAHVVGERPIAKAGRRFRLIGRLVDRKCRAITDFRQKYAKAFHFLIGPATRQQARDHDGAGIDVRIARAAEFFLKPDDGMK